MQTFTSTREAKEFIVDAIVAEAQRQNEPLSETERKMLYFSETAWTLPDIYEVNSTFEREYENAEYEEKIAAFIRNLLKRFSRESPQELASWKGAVRLLRTEDHYLIVLIDIADGVLSPTSSERQPPRFLKLVGIGISVFGIAAAIFLLYVRLSN